MDSMFRGAQQLQEVPVIKNAKPKTVGYMFYDCYQLKTIPDGWTADWDWSALHTSTNSSAGYVFDNCHSLRHISTEFLKNLYTKGTSASYVPYNYGFMYCYVLDEINSLGVGTGKFTSNRFTSMVDWCCCLKNLTFDTNDDGSPKTAQWQSQTLNLSLYVGYTGSYALENYGMSLDKKVTDDASYQALKNDPDWWTNNEAYSRYNHDSAVTTINSLPDCSATGTNTIKFKGTAGSATDGGAINTLTEEEIAVATAKGWTVSFA
jgi:hypothetical protein